MIVQDVVKQIARLKAQNRRADVLHIGRRRFEELIVQISGGEITFTPAQANQYEQMLQDGVPRLLGSVLGLDVYTSNDENECRAAEWGE